MSYTLALGPFATAWRGPQRFVLRVEGERIADVTCHGGYNERGCAERLPRLKLEEALHLVTRICSASSVAHALAFCQALEALMDMEVADRAAYLRCVGAELERTASHLGALIALFEAMDQQRAVGMLRELQIQARQGMHLLSGKLGLPNLCLPGGVQREPDDQQCAELRDLLGKLNRQLFKLTDQLIDQRALLARTVEIGTLTRDAVTQLGLRGPLARGSGVSADVRIDQPYAAYDQLQVRLITQEGGDVYARLVVLFLETLESVKLAEQALENLPKGRWRGTFPQALRAGESEAAVESPQGLLRYRLESDGQRLTSVTIDPPHQLDRLTARALLNGALLDNVVLIVLSTDPCTACAEC